MSDLKAEPIYDPFPKSGPIKQYEPLIRFEVNKFCNKYRHLSREEVLSDAVSLAYEAARVAGAKRRKVTAAYLRIYLKGLHRLYVGRDLARRRVTSADDLGEKPDVRFLSGANGARLTFDVPIVSVNDGRHRLRVAVQLPGGEPDYVLDVRNRISRELPALRNSNWGYLEGAIDHAERRTREAQEEAENRRLGRYDPVFLKPRRLRADTAIYKGPAHERTFPPQPGKSQPYSPAQASQVHYPGDGGGFQTITPSTDEERRDRNTKKRGKRRRKI